MKLTTFLINYNMGTDRINILIGSDINYAPYYGVMLTSLFMNNSESCFDIHLLTDKTWTAKATAKFQKIAHRYQSDFHVYIVDEKQMEQFPLGGHLTLPTYYNLCASSLLPESIHRIIYMDGDMIVNGDIRPLWELDLKEMVCAQVIGAAYYDEEQYVHLGYDKHYGVYNNGVVVYDFDKMRAMDFSRKAIQFISDNPEKVKWMDQDTMNALLYDKTLRLPYRYNFQTLALTQERWQYYDNAFRMHVLEESNHPIVIHYSGHVKPWSFCYYGFPFGSLWNRYCALSEWKNSKQRKPILKYIKYLIKHILMRSSFRRRCETVYIKEAWNLR